MVRFDETLASDASVAFTIRGGTPSKGSDTKAVIPEGYASVSIAVRDHLGFTYVYPEYLCPLSTAELVVKLAAVSPPS